MDNTDKYYLLHRLTGGDIQIVASLIELIANKPKIATLSAPADLFVHSADKHPYSLN